MPLTALLIVDVQYGFMPDRGLPVADGDAIIVPVINRIAPGFTNEVLTQDKHLVNHILFAATHSGRQPFETIDLSYGPQVLWSVHCVQGTHDAALHADRQLPQAQLIIRKGFHKQVDSYSAFVEADCRTTTGLEACLEACGTCSLCLCADYCVAWSALDARSAGFEVAMVEDACRAIDLNGSLAAAWADMMAAGVRRVQSAQLLAA